LSTLFDLSLQTYKPITTCNKKRINWEDSTDAKLHTHSQLIVAFSWPLCRCCHCAATAFANAATTAMGRYGGTPGCCSNPLHHTLQRDQCLLLIAAVRSTIQDADCSLPWPVDCCYLFLFHHGSHSHTLSAIADITGNCFLYPTVSSTITAHHGNTWCPFLCPATLFPLLLCILLFSPLHLVDFYLKII